MKHQVINNVKGLKKVNMFNNIKIFNVFNNIKLSIKLFLMSLLPLIILGSVTLGTFSTTYINSAVSQTEEDLYAITATLLSAYEQNSGKYFYSSNDNLWKGSYNISLSKIMLEDIKERTNNDITIVRFDEISAEDPTKEIIATTAVDAETGEQLEYVLDDTLKEKISTGSSVFADGLTIDGVQQYFYATPLIQDQTEDEVIGAIISSASKDKKLGVAYNMMEKIIIISVLIIIISVIFTIAVANNITTGFRKGFRILEDLSKGKLNVDTESIAKKRKDEIGDMFKNIINLKESLKDIISGNLKMSHNIEGNVTELNNTANAAQGSVGIIDDAIAGMNHVAAKQANIANKVTKDIEVLGDMIENTYTNIQELNTSNIELQNSNKTATKVVEDLNKVKNILNEVITTTTKQTKDTYVLTKDIRRYAGLITEFAEETNLLALNATIEAARVGEKGKGFAIVAGQIQNLADQSNVVSSDITTAVNTLVEDTKRSVKTMNRIKDIVETLNINIEDTREVFDVVNVSVDNSLVGLKRIEDQAAIMDDTRGSITNVMRELDDVIQANKRSMANTKEVTDHIGELFVQSNNIKDATGKLLESINKFEL